MTLKTVYVFGGSADHSDPRQKDKTVVGGKGANLAEMASIGLPVEGIGIMIALDTLPDMFKTLLNVTADMLVAVMTVPAGELVARVE